MKKPAKKKTAKKKTSKGKVSKIHSIDVRVGQRIKEFRKSLGMTQKHLAIQIGVKFQQVQKYETAQNRVSASRLWMIAEVLGVKAGDFFEEG